MKEVKVLYPKGIHTRVAAKLAHQASLLNKKYDVQLFLKKKGEETALPMSSMIALTALSIRENDWVIITSNDHLNSEKAVEEMCAVISETLDYEKSEYDAIDEMLDQNTLTSEQLIESITNGLVAVNRDNIITIFNQSAERIMGINRRDVIGKKACDVLENSGLAKVLRTGQPVVNVKQKINHTTIITNRSPIVVNNEVIGAVATFKDITDIEKLSATLESTKETKKRLSNILENANDGICMVDPNGVITFSNPRFAEICKKELSDLIHQNIQTLSMEEKVLKALKKNEVTRDLITKLEDNRKILSNISPIKVQNKFKGNVWIITEITALKKVMQDLDYAEQKIKEYQEVLIEKTQEGIDEAFGTVIGRSKPMERVLKLSTKAAKTSMTVLIRGESGTGKELIAKSIWQASPRKAQPFIGINCAAIPENLLESELFGHEKGSFTGANRQKIGKFELADGGVLFLDEIGDLSLSLQVKLLRVLQEKELQRVGGNEKIPIDVRIITATNQNLEKLIEEKKFRLDLYYRLNVIPINLPPLRDRKEDISDLVTYFLDKTFEEENMKPKRLTTRCLAMLRNYHWPGNIRELENIIKRMIVFSESKELTGNDIPNYIKEALGEAIEPINDEMAIMTEEKIYSMEEYEKVIIEKALNKYESFNRTGKALGLSHRTVARKARKYGIIDD